MYKGATEQGAEKLKTEGGRGPQRRVLVTGVGAGGFNPRIKPAKSARALALEVCFPLISPEISSFSAASEVAP
jgi:hypothetical protein